MPAAQTPARKLVLLVGTVKGLFLYESDERREQWTMTGPRLGGWEVFSVAGDPRQDRILAGAEHFSAGPSVRSSRDRGVTWTAAETEPRLPADGEPKVKHIWQLVPGTAAQPGTWYAGVDDAALFVSRDDARTWTELTGLTSHPTRPRWTPGFGGLCLHSVLVDPANGRRLWVGISSVGVFRSDDGGETWVLKNEGLHNVAPEFITDPDMGRCVHKLVLDPQRAGVLYLQFHGGVFMSDNAGDTWKRISQGLPHDFGFPMAISAQGSLFVVPLLADDNRVVPEGALKVWRSRDQGRTWRALTAGLPQQDHYVGVLRDAMVADPFSPAGIYFGTTAGELYRSSDDGDTWVRLPGQFPRITTVKAWVPAG